MSAMTRPTSKARASASAPAAAGTSVIMVVYFTGAAALADSLRHVLAEPLVDELVVVDNGSSPAEAEAIDTAARDPRVRVLRGHGNLGFARGANVGAKAAHGRMLVFLNPDAFLQPGCIAALSEALDGDAGRLVGARVLSKDGLEQRGARRGEVTPMAALCSLTGLARLAPLRGFEIHHEGDAAPAGPIPVPTISGACFAMTREGFDRLGGFDEGYFLHVEDVDLCWRVRREGGQVLFHPDARVVHLGSTSLKSPMIVEYWKGLGLARYFRKRAETPPAKAVAWLLFPAIVGVSMLRASMKRRAARA